MVGRGSPYELFADAYGRYCATTLERGWIHESSFWFPEVQVNDQIQKDAAQAARVHLRPLVEAARDEPRSRLEMDLALEIGRFHLLHRTQALYQDAIDGTERTAAFGHALRGGSELGLVVVGTVFPWTKAARPFISAATGVVSAGATTYADTRDVGRVIANVTLSAATASLFKLPMHFAKLASTRQADQYAIMIGNAVMEGFKEYTTTMIRVGDHEAAIQNAVFGALGQTKGPGRELGAAVANKGLTLARSQTIILRTAPSPAVGQALRQMDQRFNEFSFPLQRPQEQASWIASHLRWAGLRKLGRAASDEPFKQAISNQHARAAARQVADLPVHRSALKQ